jgi:hypothetical protein
MRRIFLVAALVFSTATAQAQSIKFPSIGDGVTQFVTASKEIGCTFIPFDGANGIDTGQNSSELHCYLLNDKQAAVSLGVKGKARGLIVRGELDCCAGNNVLALEKSWAAGGYKCKSERSGLTCTKGSHGFTLGRAKIKLF